MLLVEVSLGLLALFLGFIFPETASHLFEHAELALTWLSLRRRLAGRSDADWPDCLRWNCVWHCCQYFLFPIWRVKSGFSLWFVMISLVRESLARIG